MRAVEVIITPKNLLWTYHLELVFLLSFSSLFNFLVQYPTYINSQILFLIFSESLNSKW